MGYGFGFPLFNFYPPLPYIVGQVFRFLGATFVDTAKYTFAVAFVASGVSMYYLAKEFFGRIGGTLSAVFYLWAPYHAVDIYVRGAMNEAWALVWFPLILWTSYRLIIEKKRKYISKWLTLLALSYAALLLTHNLMVLIFTPVLGAWVLLHLYLKGRWNKLVPLITSGVWSIGLAAFFTFPALFENKFTQIKGQLIGYYDYTAHFVSVRQLLFSRFWGYGASVWMEEDDMSFQIGHVHWILSLLIILFLAFKLLIWIREKDKKGLLEKVKSDKLFIVTSFMLVVGWFSAFMAHPKSIYIWKAIPQLRLTQFPWRFLTLVIFGLSFAVGYIPGIIARRKVGKNKIVKLLITPSELFILWFLVLGLVFFNWNYFKPLGGKMGALTDEEKFSGFAWDLQQTAGIYDYLPSTAVMAPRAPMSELAEVLEGEALVSEQKAGTDWGEFRIDVKSEKAVVRLGIFDFPGWEIYVDGEKAEKYLAENEEWGRMYMDLPSGFHNVRAGFENTPVRSVGNATSLLAWGGLVVYAADKRRKTSKS